jgi:hypothetical protein
MLYIYSLIKKANIIIKLLSKVIWNLKYIRSNNYGTFLQYLWKLVLKIELLYYIILKKFRIENMKVGRYSKLLKLLFILSIVFIAV